MSNETFLGFRRPDGRFGIRNYVLILPTSVCANKVAQDIARQVKGATWVNNDFGCCQVAGDARLTEKTLINVANNPNVGAIVVVGLGCEGAEPLRIAEEITALANRPPASPFRKRAARLNVRPGGFRWPATMRNNSPCKNRSKHRLASCCWRWSAAGQIRHRGWRLTLPVGSPRIS